MRWVLRITSPPKKYRVGLAVRVATDTPAEGVTVSKTFETRAETPDEFLELLYALGFAGLQKVDGEIAAVKPLTVTVYREERKEIIDADSRDRRA